MISLRGFPQPVRGHTRYFVYAHGVCDFRVFIDREPQLARQMVPGQKYSVWRPGSSPTGNCALYVGSASTLRTALEIARQKVAA